MAAYNIWGNVGNAAYAVPMTKLLPFDPSTTALLGWNPTTQALDYVTYSALDVLTNNAVRAPAGEVLSPLPNAASRAGKFVAFDGVTGDVIAADGTLGGSSSLVTFQQAGAGAVTRNSQSKMRDLVSILDFGADPTGITQSTPQIQAAIDSLPDSGGTVLVPPGIYLATNIRLDGSFGNKSNVVLRGSGPSSCIKKPDHADLTTDAARRSNVVWALRGHGHQVRDLKVSGNFSRGGLRPTYTVRHTLGDVFSGNGNALSVKLDGTSSTTIGGETDRVFIVTPSGVGQTSSLVNISFDVAAGYVTEVTSIPYDEETGLGYMNSFQLDNDFAYRAAIYMNGQLEPMIACVVEGCEVTDAVYGGIMLGAGPLSASEAYFGTLQARIIGNRCYAGDATLIGGGFKVEATIANNVLFDTNSSGIRLDDGSHRCVVTGNSIDCNDVVNANAGINVFASDSAVISGNFIKNAPSGISFNTSKYGATTGNSIRECSVGIGLRGYDSGAASGNTIQDCTSDGIRVTNGESVSITGNAIFDVGGTGVEIITCPGTTITGNTISDASGGGVTVADSNHSMITGNIVRDNGTTGTPKPGIAILGTSTNCVISANRCFDSRAGASRTQSYGVSLAGTVDASIVSNNRLTNNLTGDIDTVPTGCLIAHNGNADVEYNLTKNMSAAAGGTVYLVGAAGSENFQVAPAAGTVINRIVARGGAGGTATAPSLATDGTTADIDFRINPKGAGMLRFGTHTANADAPVTGYVTIKDSAGAVRKLAVIT